MRKKSVSKNIEVQFEQLKEMPRSAEYLYFFAKWKTINSQTLTFEKILNLMIIKKLVRLKKILCLKKINLMGLDLSAKNLQSTKLQI